MAKWKRNYDKENLAPRNLRFKAWKCLVGEHFTLYCVSNQDEQAWYFGIGPIGVKSLYIYATAEDAQSAAENALRTLLKDALSIVNEEAAHSGEGEK